MYLEEALRGCFVCGVYNEATQKKLLSKGDVKLNKVVEIAQSMEAAKQSVTDARGHLARACHGGRGRGRSMGGAWVGATTIRIAMMRFSGCRHYQYCKKCGQWTIIIQ